MIFSELAEEQRIALFAMLSRLKGKFLMSFDDCAEVRALAREHKFHLRRVEVEYILASTTAGRRKTGEVLIANRPLKLAA